ncbi:MAG: ABC transporter permease subunit [Methylobacterium sp.]|uniref:ABC transporter permease n=1 Tax=Methylobacterium sp. TaxID=409 RepID=UPI0025D11F21|nr:ABC transporter permease subunit [Methylobacterium sp.]MBX9934509.1 ABC transporter permease subunit [Methylobacterium sp.]
MSGRGHALGFALAGAALACLSHPDIAAAIVAALGEPPRKPVGLQRLSRLAGDHLLLALAGLAIVAVLGVGIGILATRTGSVPIRRSIDSLAAFAQAIPPVVVVALALPVLGFGGPPTLLALVAYGIMPVLRGTVGALESVPADAREAGHAIGLSGAQLMLQVELPLAAPGILETLRTALILAIATVAVGALAGASTLGTPIIAGLQNQAVLPLMQGTCATAALAFLCDGLMLGLADLVRRRAATRP